MKKRIKYDEDKAKVDSKGKEEEVEEAKEDHLKKKKKGNKMVSPSSTLTQPWVSVEGVGSSVMDDALSVIPLSGRPDKLHYL